MYSPIGLTKQQYTWKCKKCGRWCPFTTDICICGIYRPQTNHRFLGIQNPTQLPAFQYALGMPGNVFGRNSGPIGSTISNQTIFGGYDAPSERDNLPSRGSPRQNALSVTPLNPLRISSLLNEENTTAGYYHHTIQDRHFYQYPVVDASASPSVSPSASSSPPSGASTIGEPRRPTDTPFQSNYIQHDTTPKTNDASSAQFSATYQGNSSQGNLEETTWYNPTKRYEY